MLSAVVQAPRSGVVAEPAAAEWPATSSAVLISSLVVSIRFRLPRYPIVQVLTFVTRPAIRRDGSKSSLLAHHICTLILPWLFLFPVVVPHMRKKRTYHLLSSCHPFLLFKQLIPSGHIAQVKVKARIV